MIKLTETNQGWSFQHEDPTQRGRILSYACLAASVTTLGIIFAASGARIPWLLLVGLALSADAARRWFTRWTQPTTVSSTDRRIGGPASTIDFDEVLAVVLLDVIIVQRRVGKPSFRRRFFHVGLAMTGLDESIEGDLKQAQAEGLDATRHQTLLKQLRDRSGTLAITEDQAAATRLSERLARTLNVPLVDAARDDERPAEVTLPNALDLSLSERFARTNTTPPEPGPIPADLSVREEGGKTHIWWAWAYPLVICGGIVGASGYVASLLIADGAVLEGVLSVAFALFLCGITFSAVPSWGFSSLTLDDDTLEHRSLGRKATMRLSSIKVIRTQPTMSRLTIIGDDGAIEVSITVKPGEWLEAALHRAIWERCQQPAQASHRSSP